MLRIRNGVAFFNVRYFFYYWVIFLVVWWKVVLFTAIFLGEWVYGLFCRFLNWFSGGIYVCCFNWSFWYRFFWVGRCAVRKYCPSLNFFQFLSWLVWLSLLEVWMICLEFDLVEGFMWFFLLLVIIFWAVSIECVNICKLWKGDVAGRFDCSMLSCASKAPRVLTGFLASTAHPPQTSGRTVRRNSIRCVSKTWGCYFNGISVIFMISYR